jgi:hypothetical protein
MALRKILILRRPPPGPAFGRPEDKLHGRLEGRTQPPRVSGGKYTATPAGATA